MRQSLAGDTAIALVALVWRLIRASLPGERSRSSEDASSHTTFQDWSWSGSSRGAVIARQSGP